MTPHPKPAPKPRKPRRAIARISPRRKAKRKTLAEKKKLRPASYCSESRCRRAALHIGRCGTHATALLDGMFSRLIRERDGKCERCGTTERLQCAHVHSRRYMNTRWNLLNAMALCVGCHKWQTERVLEGQDFFIDRLGVHAYAELRRMALSNERPDYERVLASLKEEKS